MRNDQSMLLSSTAHQGFSSRHRGDGTKVAVFIFDVQEISGCYELEKCDTLTIFYALKEYFCPYLHRNYDYPAGLFDLLFLFSETNDTAVASRLIIPAEAILDMLRGRLEYRPPVTAEVRQHKCDTVTLRFSL